MLPREQLFLSCWARKALNARCLSHPPEVEKACGIAIEYFNLEDKEDIIQIAGDNAIPIKQFYEYEK